MILDRLGSGVSPDPNISFIASLDVCMALRSIVAICLFLRKINRSILRNYPPLCQIAQQRVKIWYCFLIILPE